MRAVNRRPACGFTTRHAPAPLNLSGLTIGSTEHHADERGRERHQWLDTHVHLAGGGTVRLGFNGTDTDQDPAPTAFSINGMVCANN